MSPWPPALSPSSSSLRGSIFWADCCMGSSTLAATTTVAAVTAAAGALAGLLAMRQARDYRLESWFKEHVFSIWKPVIVANFSILLMQRIKSGYLILSNVKHPTFILDNFSHFSCKQQYNNINVFQKSLSENVQHYPHFQMISCLRLSHSPWRMTCHCTFQRGCSERAIKTHWFMAWTDNTSYELIKYNTDLTLLCLLQNITRNNYKRAEVKVVH